MTAKARMIEWLSHPMEFGTKPIEIHQIYEEITEWPANAKPIDLVFFSYLMPNGTQGIGISSTADSSVAFSFLPESQPHPEPWITLPVRELKYFYAGARISFVFRNSGHIIDLDPSQPGEYDLSGDDSISKAFKFFEETIVCSEYTDFNGDRCGNCGSLECDDAISYPLASAYHALPLEYYYLGRRFFEDEDRSSL
jgi:hypothetical protein